MSCYLDPKEYYCNVPVEKEIQDCNHKVTVHCSDNKCPQPCENRLPCGHQCLLHCHVTKDPDHLRYICNKPCEKLNKGCSKDHTCKKICHEECEECTEIVQKKKSCGHEFKMQCSGDPEVMVCKKKCKKVLECGHWCTRMCNEACEPCRQNIEKVIPKCGHSVKTACGKDVTELVCQQKCELDLACGHKCKESCAGKCTTKCTENVGSILALCGHDVPLLCWENTEGKCPCL